MAGSLPLLDTLVDTVLKEGASDLHLSVGRVPVIRVAGFLIPLEKLAPIAPTDMDSIIGLFFSSDNMREFALKKEANFAFTHTSGARFRGNAFLGLGKPSIALRLVPAAIKS